MIKNIPVAQLRIGMYIHDLGCTWINHPFFRNQFKIENDSMLNKIIATGIEYVTIDTALGLDVEDMAANDGIYQADIAVFNEMSSIATEVIVSRTYAEEFERAKVALSNACKMMQNMMRDVRLGKQVSLEQSEPMIENIVDSMFNCPSSVLPQAQIKTLDKYTFQHSVAVSALTVSFGRVLDLPRQEIKELAMGGLLHDLGKAKIPLHLLNKPGKLTDDEFAVMKTHVMASAQLLKGVANLSEVSFNAAAQHHERYDGSGYPNRLKGDEISLHGQMLAIVDVYDAITSIRAYHKAIPPTEALRRLYEWSGTQFNPMLVQAFIRGIGIYPAGSLVRLESERLGIVREVEPEKSLQPVVQVIFDCAKSCPIDPEIVDLSTSDDKIKSHEAFEKWGIDQSRWAPAIT
jgi:putative nucleotidyltransferase with HDIG domain